MPPWHAWAWNVSQLMGFTNETTSEDTKRMEPNKITMQKINIWKKNSTNLGTLLEFQQATLWNPGIDLYYIHRRPVIFWATDSCGVWSCLIGVMVWVSFRIRDLWHFAKIQVTRIGRFFKFFESGGSLLSFTFFPLLAEGSPQWYMGLFNTATSIHFSDSQNTLREKQVNSAAWNLKIWEVWVWPIVLPKAWFLASSTSMVSTQEDFPGMMKSHEPGCFRDNGF